MYRNFAKIFISAEVKEFDEYIEIARKRGFGFEVQAFAFPEVMYGDWKSYLNHYVEVLKGFSHGISHHHAFYDAVTVSRDYKVVEATREKFDFNFMISREIGAKIVIAHFHWSPFYRGKAFEYYLNGQLKFWDRFINLAEEEDILLVLENTTETRPDYMMPIIERANSPHFQVIFDPGHANLFSEVPLTQWVRAFGDHLRYIHFHTNHGVYDEHIWGEGTIDFDSLFNEISKMGQHPIFATEIYNTKELLSALDFLEDKLEEYKI